MIYKTDSKTAGITKVLAVEPIFNNKLMITIVDSYLYQELAISINNEQVKELAKSLNKWLEGK